MLTDRIPYANRNLDAQVMHDLIRGILPSSKPVGIQSANKKSHTKLWELILSTWQREPSLRPDIMLVSRLIEECRTHQGPALSADLDARIRPLNSISTSSSSQSMSTRAHGSYPTKFVGSGTRLIPPYGGRGMGRSRSNPGTPRHSTTHLQVGDVDGTVSLTTNQRSSSFIISSSSSSTTAVTSNAPHPTAPESINVAMASTTSLPIPSHAISVSGDALSYPSQSLHLGGIEEESDGDDGEVQRSAGPKDKYQVANKVEKANGLRRLLSMQDLANISSRSSVNSTRGRINERISTTLTRTSSFASLRPRMSSESRTTRKMPGSSLVETAQNGMSQSGYQSFDPSHLAHSLHPSSSSTSLVSPNASGFNSLRRSLSANWKSTGKGRSSLHQRSDSVESFQPSTTAHHQVWHDN